MINKDFYPTPEIVAHQMLSGLQLENKNVLEPQAGSGKLLDIIREYSPSRTFACESDPVLKNIVIDKCNVFLGDDFLQLKSSDVSHIHFIIMNPPFSNASKHILHAYEIAPEGCTIVSLANYETIDNPYSRERKLLKRLITDTGTQENIGDVFTNAERKTNIDIALIRIFKPISEQKDEFADYFFTDEERSEFTGTNGGLIKANDITEIVGRYVQSVLMFDSFMNKADEINQCMSILGGDFTLKFRAHNENDNGRIDRDSFKNKLQKSSWRIVFKKLNMGKYLTSKIMDELNKRIESQVNLPFTEKNIYNLVGMIAGTHESRMKATLIEIFDWLTDRHDENRLNLEGWKTNSMYFVDMKFIAPYCGISRHYNGGAPEVRWSTSGEKIDEFVKALCVLTGTNYDTCTTLYDHFRSVKVPNDKQAEQLKDIAAILERDADKCSVVHNRFRYYDPTNERANDAREYDIADKIGIEKYRKLVDYYSENYDDKAFGEKYEYKEWGKWMDWNFFEIKVFKKGTLHAKFKDKKVWEMFNIQCAKAKGWRLPTKTGSDVRRNKNGVEIFEPTLF